MPDQTPKPAATNTGGGSKSLVIILVVVFALIILGVGGYFGWKYFSSHYIKTGASTKASPSASSSLTLAQLEQALVYPKGTLVSTDRSESAGYTSVLEMKTPDGVTTVNNYYLSLDPAGRWTVTSKSMESDSSRADITLEGVKEKFTVHLIIDVPSDQTEILARIDAENLPKGSSLGTSPTATTSAAASPGSASNTSKTISGDYVIADSNTRLINKGELFNLTPWQLKVARNEIYARHGRPFVHKDLQCYFATKSWYHGNPDYSDSLLTTVDNKNVATILEYEQSINSPLLEKDTGC